MEAKKSGLWFLVALGHLCAATASDAAVGDLLKTVSVPVAAQCSIGTSVAVVPGSLVGFPGTPILLVISCFEGSDLFYLDPSTNPATLVKTVATTPTAAGGWGSLAFRADQNDITGCGNDGANHPIYSIDPNTGAATFLFNSVSGLQICDGHSWDASDQSFYVSPDVSSTVYHFSATGTALGSFPSACSNSGVAVGGDVLYEACDGTLSIFRVNKTTHNVIGSFAFPGQRTEDLECDPVSFAAQGVDGMWSKDAFLNEVFAFEIPPGECGLGGTRPGPSAHAAPALSWPGLIILALLMVVGGACFIYRQERPPLSLP